MGETGLTNVIKGYKSGQVVRMPSSRVIITVFKVGIVSQKRIERSKKVIRWGARMHRTVGCKMMKRIKPQIECSCSHELARFVKLLYYFNK